MRRRESSFASLVRRAWLTLVVLVLGLVLGACAQASGEASGGEPKFDPTPPTFTEPSACPKADETDAGSGATWTDLWRDLFGPSGAAKCADPSCHGSPGGTAAKVGILCVDQVGCRQALLDKGWIQPADFESPETSGFYTVLRRCDPQNQTVGTMPLRPSNYHFSPASLARVATWMRNGAKND